MSQKIENDPKGEQEEGVYYVENVEGDDFTFYLDFDEDNKRLLTGETSHQDEEQQSSKEGFSNSTTLRVKILPLLTEKDFIEDGRNLLDKLKEAIEQSQSEPESETSWSRLVGKFPEDLKEIVRTDWQKAETKAILLQKILKQLNNLLMTEVMAELLDDRVDDLNMAEKELIKNFSKSGEQAYKNRKTFNKHFYEAINPFQPPLPEISGRALICRTYQGKFLSISFRKKPSKSSYAPAQRTSIEYPLSIKNYCDELYEAIFEFKDKGAAKRGLLIIAGATNSSKSEIATGLIYTYLDKRREDSKGRPHLVTFEDPIEKFYELPGESKAPRFSVAMLAAKNGIDYTPREKGNAYEKDKDVESLKDALEDALRQTPTILFVGETRDKGDWRRLVDFAGTGHLIVTTAHAGSLTEAMHKIFVALKVRTPAERSEIANRLLGIIHIKRHADTNILVPAVWRRTPTGKNALTAEGLSSLLPYRPEGDDPEKGCLGRAWFVKNLIEHIDESRLTKEKKELLEKEAIEWDLEGV
jgi:Tfp pilus assembly pilus retraction ATPase PilT